MTYSKKLWLWLGGIFLLSFAILGLIGREIYVTAPPVPASVTSASGETLFTKADIQDGREVWQTLGGMQLGSVWGHGGYVAPRLGRRLVAPRSHDHARQLGARPRRGQFCRA